MRVGFHQGSDGFLGLPLSVLTLPSGDTVHAELGWWSQRGVAWAGLFHPYLLKTYRFDRGRRAGAVWMERPPGISLGGLLARGAPLAEGLRVWLEGLVSVLHLAHQHGLAHGALTPEDVWLTPGGLMLMPFHPLQMMLPREAAADEEYAPLLGFQAPEQWQSLPTSASDVYGLGALLFAIATGHPPFVARDPDVLADLVANQPAANIDTAHGFPQPLAAVVASCLAKRPEDRPSSVLEVFRALYHGDLPPLIDWPAANELKVAGMRLFVDGRYEEALERWNEAHRLNPSEPVVLHNLGAAHFLLGRREESVDAFTRSLRLSPYQGLARAGLSRALYFQGHYKEAAHAFHQAIYCWPGLRDFGYGSICGDPESLESFVLTTRPRTGDVKLTELEATTGLAGSHSSSEKAGVEQPTRPQILEIVAEPSTTKSSPPEVLTLRNIRAVIRRHLAIAEAFTLDAPWPADFPVPEIRIPWAIEALDFSQSLNLLPPSDPDGIAAAAAIKVPPRRPRGLGR